MEWIDVKTALPSDDEVLCINENGTMWLAYYYQGGFYDSTLNEPINEDRDSAVVTHWMPLPLAPNAE